MSQVGRVSRVGLVSVFVLIFSHAPDSPYPPYSPLFAQQPDRALTEAQARRVNERMVVLQREAERLAGEARTLVGDLR